MTEEGRGMNQGWSPAVRRKLQELADLVAEQRFGEAGIPKEITFSEIEEIGPQVGQLAAGTIDQALQQPHAEHLAEVAILADPRRHGRIGRTGLSLSRLRARFFPSASPAETRRARV